MAESIPLTDLNTLPYNPRIITAQELDGLKASIKEHTKAIPRKERAKGFRLVSTITVNRNGNRIIGGHQRVKALHELGQNYIDARDITWVQLKPDSPEEKALNVTLNDPHKQGSYDEAALDEVLSDIKTADDELFGRMDFGTFKPDTTPEEPTQSFSKDKSKKKEQKPVVELELPEPESTEALEEDKEPLEEPKPQLYPFSCALLIEQREIILKTIKEAKKDIETQESAVALAHICKYYTENMTTKDE